MGDQKNCKKVKNRLDFLRFIIIWQKFYGRCENVKSTPRSVLRPEYTLRVSKVSVLCYSSLIKSQLIWCPWESHKNFIYDDQVFKTKTYFNFKIKNHLFEELMHIAILEDKTEFVKLFIENDFSLKQFLTYERLLQLYNEVIEK